MRGTMGVIAGLIGAALTMVAISFLGAFFVPAPAPVDPSSVEAIRSTYSSLDVNGRLLVIADWFFGALAGAGIAKRIVGKPWAAWTVAGLVEAYIVLSILMLPMPAWMQVAALAAPLVAGLLANHLVANRVALDQGDMALEGAGADGEA